MLKSGKKRARKEYEKKINSREFKESFIRKLKKPDTMLHVKVGFLYYNDHDDSLYYTPKINYGHQEAYLCSPNTFLTIKHIDEEKGTVFIKNIKEFKIEEVIRWFKIAPKLKKRTINF